MLFALVDVVSWQTLTFASRKRNNTATLYITIETPLRTDVCLCVCTCCGECRPVLRSHAARIAYVEDSKVNFVFSMSERTGQLHLQIIPRRTVPRTVQRVVRLQCPKGCSHFRRGRPGRIRAEAGIQKVCPRGTWSSNGCIASGVPPFGCPHCACVKHMDVQDAGCGAPHMLKRALSNFGLFATTPPMSRSQQHVSSCPQARVPIAIAWQLLLVAKFEETGSPIYVLVPHFSCFREFVLMSFCLQRWRPCSC